MAIDVLVGMSGGVDSTVTAILLQKQGYNVVGVYMKLHTKEGYHEANFTKASRVADYLGIKIHFLDIQDEFNKEVYDYFIDGYRDGLTPNPCTICNRTIKFGRMVEFADSLGIKFVSTGHYLKCDGKFIYQAKDKTKDQSYFLSLVKKEVLSRVIFPLGDWLKEDVKVFGEDIEPLKDIATQKESSEICFVENEYTEILEKHMNIDIPGETINSNGDVVGTHKGYMHYTIGKRRGFFVNGAHDPHFVLDIKSKTNQIVVGKRDELAVTKIKLKNVNMFEDLTHFECDVKVRYRTSAVMATVSIDGDNGFVELKDPAFGVAKAQVTAFYIEDRLIGGGIIC